MAKKEMKTAATAGTWAFEQIATGNAPSAKDAEYVQNVKNVKNRKDAPKKKEPVPQERLNLKIPTEIKEYLNVAAARASIEQRRNVSLTEYLCEIVKADMKKHGDK